MEFSFDRVVIKSPNTGNRLSPEKIKTIARLRKETIARTVRQLSVAGYSSGQLTTAEHKANTAYVAEFERAQPVQK